MKIQELADLMGLTPHTIRFYEKEGLLDSRHIQRERNNYRNYSDEAIGRLKLIKKFQGIGCTLAELKTILQEQDTSARTNQEVITWILQKIQEIERKKDEYDHMLVTLNWMLTYRKLLDEDPSQAEAMMDELRQKIDI
ncbi:MerR family transcriptional regulator [Paenibacillus timonensis]|uniref:MerR family transcriptional regulator n=1 Tax=Paenibacillus timonensis TaxID=225915 RepID=UPI003F9489C2